MGTSLRDLWKEDIDPVDNPTGTASLAAKGAGIVAGAAAVVATGYGLYKAGSNWASEQGFSLSSILDRASGGGDDGGLY